MARGRRDSAVNRRTRKPPHTLNRVASSTKTRSSQQQLCRSEARACPYSALIRAPETYNNLLPFVQMTFGPGANQCSVSPARAVCACCAR